MSRNLLIFPLYILSATVGIVRHLRRRDQSPAPVSMLFVIGTGLLLTLVSVLRDTPGGLQVAAPIVFGPCVYYAIALGLDRRTTDKIPLVVAFSTAVVSVSVLIVAFSGPQGWMFWLDPFAGSDSSSGAYIVRMGALGSLAGLIPFMAYYVAAWQGLKGRRYTAYLSVLALSFAAAFVASRTAVVLVAVLSVTTAPLARMIWWRTQSGAQQQSRRAIPRSYYLISFIALGVAALTMFTSFSVGTTVERTVQKFGGGNGVTASATPFANTNHASAELRLEQADFLLDGFFKSPVLGDSAGTIGGLVRDERRPWAYELQYHLLLFRNGLMGAGLYLLAVAVGIRDIRRRWPTSDSRTKHVTVAAMAAAAGILIANATNPYLQAVGQQWALFLPVMVICARGPARPNAGDTASGSSEPADLVT